MNIKLTENEFDQFIMLYLKDRMESIDELPILDENGKPDIFYTFIDEMKNKGFWPLLNKVFLDAPMIQKVNTNRIIKEKDKPEESGIHILM